MGYTGEVKIDKLIATLKMLDIKSKNKEEIDTIIGILERLDESVTIGLKILGIADHWKSNPFGSAKEASSRVISYLVRGA